jgi:Tfp pilus assembly PilM family ATPase
MFLAPRQSRSPIGLDVGARRVKAVQLEPTPAAAGWRVVAATSINRTAPGEPVTADEAARVADTLDRLGFTGSRVVVAAPADKLIVGMLELPRAGGQIPLEQIARVELARTNKVAPDSFEMGSWELPVAARAGKTVQVMAVGYPHGEAMPFLDVLESSGLDVTALDVRTCSLARACSPALAPAPAITALVGLGWSSASLALLYAGTIVFVRAMNEGALGRVHEALARQQRFEPDVIDYVLDEVGLRDVATAAAVTSAGAAAAAAAAGADHPVSPNSRVTPGGLEPLELPGDARNLLTTYADALVRELLVSFSYVARQYTDSSVTRLLLTGAGAPIPGLAEYLARELGVETRPIAPKDLAECPASLLDACSSPELTPALGLAMFPDT